MSIKGFYMAPDSLRGKFSPRVALVHDWLIHMRGGEKVLESLAEMYPDAIIYTLFFDRSKLSPSLQKMKIRTSWLNAVPGIRKFYRWLLPLMPLAISSLKLEPVDLVISSSHCVAKGIRVPAHAFHICYCHTPMRYLWGYEKEYFGSMAGPLRIIARLFFRFLKNFDLSSNPRVNEFIANSKNVQERIRKFYEREATVIYPPLDTNCYHAGSAPPALPEAEYYLVVSAFVPYKRVDLVIQAFNEMDRRLLIVGGGPLEKAYRRLRKSGMISFLRGVSNEQLQKLYAGARAVLFPTEEDFGIVPLEAQACGTPVIALSRGGALESVKTGHFFNEQTPEAIRRAVFEFEQKSFDRDSISSTMSSFSKEFFKKNMTRFIETSLGCRHD